MLRQPILKHQADFCSFQTKYEALCGGFGSGKTEGILFRCLTLLQKRKGKAKIIVVEPTLSMVRDILKPAFDDFFDNLNIIYHYRAVDYQYTTAFGVILLRSGDRPERIKGIRDVTDFIVDEIDSMPIDKADKLFIELIARLRGCSSGTGGFASTPEGFAFLYNRFDPAGKDYNKNYNRLITADTRDNIFLPKDYIQSLFDNYDERLVEQYILGKFVNIRQGRVYYSFNRDKNLKDITFNPIFPLLIAYDFNINPFCLTISQYDKKNKTLYTIDEIKLQNSNTEEATLEVVNRYKNKTNEIHVYGDASGHSRSTKAEAGKTDYKIIQNILDRYFTTRLRVKKSNVLVRDRINSTNNSFKKLQHFISPKCHNLIRDYEQVCHKEKTSDIDKNNMDLTHMSDANTYLIDSLLPIRRVKTPSMKGLLAMSETGSAFDNNRSGRVQF